MSNKLNHVKQKYMIRPTLQKFELNVTFTEQMKFTMLYGCFMDTFKFIYSMIGAVENRVYPAVHDCLKMFSIHNVLQKCFNTTKT